MRGSDGGEGTGGVAGGDLRKEADFEVSGLVLRGYGDGAGGFGDRFGSGFGGLEAFELVEGVAVIALGGVDAALEAGEDFGILAESFVEGLFVDVGFLPELGFDFAEAAEEPFGIDEDIELGALGGGGGAVAVVIFGGEGFELGDGFAGDGVGAGIDSSFEGVHGGAGLAFGGARTGGFQ